MADSAQIEFRPEHNELVCSGNWTISLVDAVEKHLAELWATLPNKLKMTRDSIQQLDTAGAILLLDLEKKLQAAGKDLTVTELIPQCESMFALVQSHIEPEKKSTKYRAPNWLAIVGEWTVIKLGEGISFVGFVGHFIITLIQGLRHPRQINWLSILAVIEDTGYQALPIVALLLFLVGIVLTYQIAIQLSTYGANIFIVDLTGMIIFREFGPLITAIIAAGRTSTSFTAQIGSMKVNEEIDALETMGISTFIRIVLPKIVGLLIAMPLLCVWADIFGVLGAMFMSRIKLGVSYFAYLERFEHQVLVKHFVVGLVKAPVFAILIALVGSYQGLQVLSTADSVGRKTTRSAVQSIFLIIIADAIFSVVFSVRGI